MRTTIALCLIALVTATTWAPLRLVAAEFAKVTPQQCTVGQRAHGPVPIEWLVAMR